MDIYFSAADLCKKSAAQILYLRNKQERIRTWRMEMGIKYQHQVAEQKEDAAEEFRTSIADGDIVIFACHDIVCPDKLIEVKSIEGETEQWYFESSLLQTAYYKSIVMSSDGHMFTPKFRLREGYKKEHKKVNPNIAYHLLFGEEEFDIEVQNPQKMVEYFFTKAEATLLDYATARAYDAEHKFKHYEELKECFTWKKL